MRFTVLVDSDPPVSDPSGAVQLAGALTALGHAVRFVEAPLAEAPADGWLLYFGAARPARDALASDALRRRLVLMDLTYATGLELQIALGVPLVVTSRGFHNWRHRPSSWAQVVAAPASARALGIAMSRDDARERYVQFTIPQVPLPAGIARWCASRDRSASGIVRRLVARVRGAMR